MILRQIALLSTTPRVALSQLTVVSAALQKQVSRDFSPIWQVNGTVDAFATEADVPPGYWKIIVQDEIGDPRAAGYHFDPNGQPRAVVKWSAAWSLTASHECLEMLADPFGHQFASGPSIRPGQGRVTYLVEICDPCEAGQFAYTINTGWSGGEILVSDFYTPSYFDPSPIKGVRYSFRGNVTQPRQVLSGGYLSWQDPTDGHVWQLFGPADMGEFRDDGPGMLSRENTDRLARKSRHAAAHA
jgi:hypothetical protein